MPFNGSGIFQRVRNWVADATAGIKIRADYHDIEDDGFAAGLTNCITKDGQTVVTQNIPFNSKRITGLADPVNDQDASTKKYTDTKLDKASTAPLTGNLEIEKEAPGIVLDDTKPVAEVSGGNQIGGLRLGKQRWLLRIGTGEAETGANAGSNFYIDRYADDGAHLGSPLNFSRATGLGVVAANPTAPLGIVTKQYADAAANPRVLRAGDTMTGQLTSAPSQSVGYGGPAGSFLVSSATSNAAMSFLVPGFGANFGLASDGNFYMGGWSHGATAYKFWTTRDFTVTHPPNTVTDGRLLYAGTAQFPFNSTWTEPYAGAVATGFYTIFGGNQFVVQQCKWRFMQLFSTIWYTVGYE